MYIVMQVYTKCLRVHNTELRMSDHKSKRGNREYDRCKNRCIDVWYMDV